MKLNQLVTDLYYLLFSLVIYILLLLNFCSNVHTYNYEIDSHILYLLLRID